MAGIKPGEVLLIDTGGLGQLLAANGHTLGYGRRYRVTAERERIAFIPCGYHDAVWREFARSEGLEPGETFFFGAGRPRAGVVGEPR